MSPSNVISISIGILIVSSLASSVIGLNAPFLSLNESQILYLYSSSTQILAAIYGLTLTGFIFFRNELSREEFEDETLIDAVESLKDRYFKILIFVTALSIFTIGISNLVLSFDSEDKNMAFTVLMNVGQSSFFINLLVIAYFIFDVIGPKRIEKESKNIRQLIDPLTPEEAKGSLESFLKNYNKIEYILQKYGEAYQAEIEGTDRRHRKRISNIRLAEFILRAEKIDADLYNEIRSLVTLRNSIIHGAEPVVSQNMIAVSQRILSRLEETLGINN